MDTLHPERESLTTLRMLRQSMGPYNFSGQYQQNPIPVGGAIVKLYWLQYYEIGEKPEQFSAIVQSWDSANKSTEMSDFSVCTTWGVLDGRFYLLDVLRKRLDFPDLKRAVINQAQRFKPNVILIEDKASGTQLIQELRSQGVFGVTAYEPPPGADKQMRLYAQTTVFEEGRVVLPRQAPWLFDYIAELTGFPGSRYADQVDSTTQALDHMKQWSGLEVWRRLGEMYATQSSHRMW